MTIGEYFENKHELEMNTLSSSLENAPPPPEGVSPDVRSSVELTQGGSEYFGLEGKNTPGKNKKKKNFLISKLIAATATVAVGTAAVAIAAMPLPPVALEPAVIEYRAEYFDTGVEGDPSDDVYVSPSYDIEFAFDIMDYEPISITVEGTYSEFDYMLDKPQETIVDIEPFTVSADDLTYGEDGTVSTVYTVDNVDRMYKLTPTLRYMSDGEEKSLKGDSFSAGIPSFKNSELGSENSIKAKVGEDRIDVTVSFGGFAEGCFDFKVEGVSIYYMEREIKLGEAGAPPLPEIKDGRAEFTISLEKPEGESVHFEAEIYGDSYFNGEKMNLESASYARQEIILGTAYSAEKISYDLTRPEMSANGLSVRSVRYLPEYGGYTDEIKETVAGRTVYITVMLEGTALADGFISPLFTFNEAKIGSVDYTYAENVEVHAGDEYAMLEISFTMPADNITSEDIVLNGIVYQESIQ